MEQTFAEMGEEPPRHTEAIDRLNTKPRVSSEDFVEAIGRYVRGDRWNDAARPSLPVIVHEQDMDALFLLTKKMQRVYSVPDHPLTGYFGNAFAAVDETYMDNHPGRFSMAIEDLYSLCVFK